MKLYAPDYYPAFHCIADRCRHSCCIGWEIDIDRDTLAAYRQVSGPIGERLRADIEENNDGACFRLDEHERCPFLNPNGLCDLIATLGESSLCEICAEHPRFRNFFADRTEIGLGLCCEEAARLILTHQSQAELILLEDDGEPSPESTEEADFFDYRAQIIALLQDRRLSVEERVKRLLAQIGISSEAILGDDRRWVQVYIDLEHLDPEWCDRLSAWQMKGIPNGDHLNTPAVETALEQLLVYFVYRQLADSLEEGRREARLAFAVLSYHVIRTLTAIEAVQQGSDLLAVLIDIARSYSAEVEYSTENVEVLLDELAYCIK